CSRGSAAATSGGGRAGPGSGWESTSRRSPCSSTQSSSRGLVVDRVGHRRPGASALLALLHVERPPLGTLVAHLVVQDEAATLADQLAAFVVKGAVPRVALRASCDFFGLIVLLGRQCLLFHL